MGWLFKSTDDLIAEIDEELRQETIRDAYEAGRRAGSEDRIASSALERHAIKACEGDEAVESYDAGFVNGLKNQPMRVTPLPGRTALPGLGGASAREYNRPIAT